METNHADASHALAVYINVLVCLRVNLTVAIKDLGIAVVHATQLPYTPVTVVPAGGCVVFTVTTTLKPMSVLVVVTVVIVIVIVVIVVAVIVIVVTVVAVIVIVVTVVAVCVANCSS